MGCPVDNHTCLMHSAMMGDAWIHAFLLSTCNALMSHLSVTQLDMVSLHYVPGLPPGPSTHLASSSLELSVKAIIFIFQLRKRRLTERKCLLSAHTATVEIPTSFCWPLILCPPWMRPFCGFLKLPEVIVKKPNSFAFALLGD